MGQAGNIIDAAIKSGFNKVDYVIYFVKESVKKQWHDSIIAKAVQDAQKKIDLVLKPLDY